jgi:hypothetical protein
MKRFLVRGTLALVGATAVALCASASARADTLSGAVGWHSPAAGTLPVDVTGRSTADPLATASVTLSGTPIGTLPLCEGSTPCTVGSTKIGLDTTAFTDGTYDLVVTISDTTGHAVKLLDKPDFEILNHPPQGSPTQTLNVGSGSSPQQNGSANNNGSGGVAGESASSCTSPKLSMQLAQKPLRVSKGHPVLQKGKGYRFAGRLTCLINNERRSAPAKTKVEENDVVKGKRSFKGGTLVRDSGRVSIIIAVTSSRTIEFSVTDANGKTSRVRITVTVSKKRKG